MNLEKYLSEIRRFEPDSHKGQNGKVLLIGGSELFHAASRWSLDVLSTMVDMVFYSSVPTNNELIREAKGEFWGGVVVPRGEVEQYLVESDVILIGPGMVRAPETTEITNSLLSKYPEKKWVVDAGALQMVDPKLLTKSCIVTPHEGEFQGLMERAQKEWGKGGSETILDSGITILLKGEKDHVFDKEREEWVSGGNPGMTKGGTGDVLAGIVAGLYSMTDDAFSAAVVASYVNKQAGDKLFEEYGPFFSTNLLVEMVPHVLGELLYKKK